MKVSDFIVEFLIDKGISDVFAYPGGMVTHLMDSFEKYYESIKYHINYNEQGSSFSACGYGQTSLKPGVAFATSGPGATNLVTGIANAYFDSIPCLFITGQVNTYESKGNLKVRQKGFQEMDVVNLVRSITKFSKYIDSAEKVPQALYDAYCTSLEGRKGPVLLDIPMDIQRADISIDIAKSYIKKEVIISSKNNIIYNVKSKLEIIKKFNRVTIVAGAGIKSTGNVESFRNLVSKLKIPVVSSMIGFDILERKNEYNFGFIGSYGKRAANFIVSKSNLIISIGSRLDCRQTGSDLSKFAPKAKIIRVDIDDDELTNKIKEDEIHIIADISDVISMFDDELCEDISNNNSKWLNICREIENNLMNIDNYKSNEYICFLSDIIPQEYIVTTDVGQNQVWVAQSFNNKANHRILFSGGHGAMGYSLPAAIGAYFVNKKAVVCIVGDGGLQMNIQELEFIRREKLPIKIILFNNHSLGMIRHFQEMYFDSHFSKTVENNGYSTPNFSKIAMAYEINYRKITCMDELNELEPLILDRYPQFIEIDINEPTYVFPKLAINKPIQDQKPFLDRELFNYINSL